MKIKQEFLDMIKDNFSGEELSSFVASFDKPIVKHIRYNPYKSIPSESALCPIEWCRYGYTLSAPRLFTTDPEFHAGAYYVQEASSMYIEEIFEKIILPEIPHPVVLDLCAAPGGKSTHLSSLIGHSGLLVANEVIRSRASILKQNIVKWGAANTIVTNSDPKDFAIHKELFDVVVADVPCSGEGMFRKNEKAMEEWSVEGVELCKSRSRRILADIWGSLKSGGYLIFSTCTFNSKENEGNLEWLCENFDTEPITTELELYGNKVALTTTQGHSGYHFYPHRVESEGYFVAVVRKASAQEPLHKERKERNRGKGKRCSIVPISKADRVALSRYVTPSSVVVRFNNTLFATTPEQLSLLESLEESLHILYFGVEIGQELKGSLKPNHALAIWCNLPKDAFPRREVDLESALEFLRRKTISAEGFDNGYNIVTYNNLPLGFVKRVGNRVNNNYPKELMILYY